MKTWFLVWTGRRVPVRRGGRKLPRGKGLFWILKGDKKIVLDFVALKGICVRWIGPRLSVFDWTDTSLGRHFERPSMKKKSAAIGQSDSTHLAPMESEFFSKLQALVSHCAVRKYDDGDPREPGWFTVKTQGAAWVVQVKDPDSACSFSAVGETLDKALQTAVLLLECDEAPWEPDTFLAAAKARKKK